ncbi:hypothetical protein OS493_039002 [Desmophyllum pertusum]|uniref:Uncharacterized protein n=1 Tax=Desmophyllum pertusum TaxID=174260 RepID=A0A9W9Y720_9CNID|nr:hypothetical protein OS493_039002 [Desmophyllum pertusum]
MEGKNTHSVTNGSISQNETRGYQPELSWVELPPPYSVENQPQQQNVWSPQATNAGLYDPPFSYPGGKPAEEHDGFYPYQPAAATSRAGVLSEDEIRRGQEAYMRHLHIHDSCDVEVQHVVQNPMKILPKERAANGKKEHSICLLQLFLHE